MATLVREPREISASITPIMAMFEIEPRTRAVRRNRPTRHTPGLDVISLTNQRHIGVGFRTFILSKPA
jgi:hypothetical protein